MIKNEEIQKAIIQYIQKHGYSPTIKEIGDMVGFRSKCTTWNRLKQMLEEGLIETDNPMSPRAIRVPGYKFVIDDGKESEQNASNGIPATI